MTVTFSKLGRLGRLGNQLFQIAGSLAVARRRGEDLSLPAWSYAADFSVPEEIFEGPHGDESHLFVPHLGTAAPYLQDYALVAEVEETVRAWFAPSAKSLEMIDKVPWHTTAIHVRRTDYLLSPRHYVALDMAYYRAAMDVVRGRYPETKFEVYSDDPQWCRANFDPTWVMSVPPPSDHEYLRDGDSHRLPNPTEMQDFWDMVSSSAVITANSAFGWWAAFLSADPSPVIPAVWYGPAYLDLDESLLIPPAWTAL